MALFVRVALRESHIEIMRVAAAAQRQPQHEIGQKQAFEIVRIAILTGGVAQWNFAYRSAEKKGASKISATPKWK